MTNLKPSLISKIYPWESVTQKSQAETVAKNIMVILARTGDTFRKLTWEEYRTERMKDGNFSESEQGFFEDVVVYATSPLQAARFCDEWADALDEALKP